MTHFSDVSNKDSTVVFFLFKVQDWGPHIFGQEFQLRYNSFILKILVVLLITTVMFAVLIFAPWRGWSRASVSSECYTKAVPLFKSCWKFWNYGESVSSHFKAQWFLFRWCNWCSLYPWSEQSWVCCLQVKYKKIFIIWFARLVAVLKYITYIMEKGI